MQDKTLTCKDCRAEFAFTARDQQFYAEKGFANEPQRCRDCRALRKTARPRAGASRDVFDATCARCDVATTVSFKPRGDRPIYCRDCYAIVSASATTNANANANALGSASLHAAG